MTNGLNDALNDLINQLAQLKFDGLLMYGVFVVVALIICFEGYKIYRLALLLMGFAVGFRLAHNVLEMSGVVLTDEQMLMVQGIAGIVCAVISTTIVKIGVFLSAYFFAKYALAVPIAELIVGKAQEKTGLPNFLIPALTSVVGLIAAFVIAKLAVESLRPVIVILTAAVGGFWLVNSFISLIPLFPYDIKFMLDIPGFIWAGVKLFIMAAGVGIQGLKGED